MPRLLFPDSGAAKASDVQIFPDRRDSLSRFQFILICLRTALAYGFLTAGDVFQTGILGGIIINIVTGLVVLHALILFVEIGAHWKKNTIDNIFQAVYGRNLQLMSTFVSCLAGILINRHLLKHGTEILWLKIGEYKDDLPSIIQLRYALMIIIAFVFVLPVSFVQSLTATFWLSVVASLVLLFLLVNAVYYMVRGLDEFGFDPAGVVTVVRGDGETWLNLFVETWHWFLIAPVAWPGIRHVVNPTASRLNGTFVLLMALLVVLSILSGLIHYFTFYNECDGPMLTKYPLDETMPLVAEYLDVVLVLLTIPQWFNPQRFVLLSTMSATENIPIDVWAVAGLIMFLISMLTVEFSGVVEIALIAIGDICSALTLFVFPAWLFIKTFKFERFLSSLGAVGVMLCGLLSIGVSIWHAAIAEPVDALPLFAGPAPNYN